MAKADFDIDRVMAILAEEVTRWRKPIVTEMVEQQRDPFKVLISTMISLRTKDDVTEEASKRLYALAETPQTMMALSEKQVAEAIYPAGFYNQKAKNILAACQRIVEEFDGQTPDKIDTLISFAGVGRKVANLVLTLGFEKDAICVDTHVHRITNRWGYVKTKNPDQTEMALRKKLPQPYWIPINDYLVSYGQHLCKPISPLCSTCRLTDHCKRIGVTKSR